MPRHARLRIAGLPVHLVQRGNNRGRCFSSEADLSLYLGLVNQFSRDCGIDIHAYVLMPNHVHLLATPGTTACVSAFMKQVGQRYAQYYNRTHGRTGAFWEGRFHSSIVDTDGYFLTCQKYIELNPVRAGLCRNAAGYEWSSFGANALGRPSMFLKPHAQYLALGKDTISRRERYVPLVEAGVAEDDLLAIRRSITSGYALGSEAFVDYVEKQLGRRARPGMPGKPPATRPGGLRTLFD